MAHHLARRSLTILGGSERCVRSETVRWQTASLTNRVRAQPSVLVLVAICGMSLAACHESPVRPTSYAERDFSDPIGQEAVVSASGINSQGEGIATAEAMTAIMRRQDFPSASRLTEDERQKLERIQASTTPTLRASVIDPEGDANEVRERRADLISATVVGRTTALIVSVQLAPGTFERATTVILVWLDTDGRRRTGFRPANTPDIGADARIWMGADVQRNAGRATVDRWQAGPFERFEEAGSVTQVTAPDSVTIEVPTSMLGGVTKNLAFRILTLVKTSPDGFTLPEMDLIPDRGLPPGRFGG